MDIQKEKKAIKGLKALYMDEWDLTEEQKDEFDALVSRVFKVGKEQTKAQAVPDGFVLVPREPTPEMLYVGYAAPNNLASRYKAMIKTAEGK